MQLELIGNRKLLSERQLQLIEAVAIALIECRDPFSPQHLADNNVACDEVEILSELLGTILAGLNEEALNAAYISGIIYRRKQQAFAREKWDAGQLLDDERIG